MFIQTSLPFGVSSFSKLFKMVDPARINPNRIKIDPARNGMKPGPGLWKPPSLSLTDPIQIATPSKTQTNPLIRSSVFK
jgi:hypothetical protein